MANVFPENFVRAYLDIDGKDGQPDRSKHLDCYFNPTEYSVAKANTWQSQDVNGKTKRWPWRANTKGDGKSREWRTTAKNDRGIFAVGVQVARFEGATILNSCVDWA